MLNWPVNGDFRIVKD